MKYEPLPPDGGTPHRPPEELVPRVLRAEARERMREGDPARPRGVFRLALIYLLLTDLLSRIALLLPGNPITALSDRVTEAYASGSPEAVMAVYNGTAALFQPPAARVLLFATILIGLYTIVMSFGFSGAMMDLHRGGQPEVRDLFGPFHMAGRIILLTLLMGVCIYLWCLLLVIPGLIAAYRYRMSRYVLLDQPEHGVFRAWRRSRELMRGHKWQMFLVDCSFLPWILLAGVLSYAAAYLTALAGLGTAGSWLAFLIGLAFSVYLEPYMELTTVGFYERIRMS